MKEGWEKYKASKRDAPGRVESTPFGDVERRRIEELFDDRYWSGLEIYNRFQVFGLPFTGGWAEQPAYLIEVIEAFEIASRAAERKRWDSGNQRTTKN